MITGTPVRAEIRPSTARPGAVQARGGLRPPGAHDPRGAAGHQDPDEDDRARPASSWPQPVRVDRAVGGDRAAVAGQDRLDRVDQAVQRGDLPGGQHDQDRQDRDAVHQRLADTRPADRRRDVAPRIDHLLRSGRGQLDPDERVQQHRDDGDEHRPGGAEVAAEMPCTPCRAP